MADQTPEQLADELWDKESDATSDGWRFYDQEQLRTLARAAAAVGARTERQRILDMLKLLADGRAEYYHGDEPQHQGDLQAMGTMQHALWTEKQSARAIYDIVRGENDGQGWLPSWLWEQLDALRETTHTTDEEPTT